MFQSWWLQTLCCCSIIASQRLPKFNLKKCKFACKNRQMSCPFLLSAAVVQFERRALPIEPDFSMFILVFRCRSRGLVSTLWVFRGSRLVHLVNPLKCSATPRNSSSFLSQKVNNFDRQLLVVWTLWIGPINGLYTCKCDTHSAYARNTTKTAITTV